MSNFIVIDWPTCDCYALLCFSSVPSGKPLGSYDRVVPPSTVRAPQEVLWEWGGHVFRVSFSLSRQMSGQYLEIGHDFIYVHCPTSFDVVWLISVAEVAWGLISVAEVAWGSRISSHVPHSSFTQRYLPCAVDEVSLTKTGARWFGPADASWHEPPTHLCLQLDYRNSVLSWRGSSPVHWNAEHYYLFPFTSLPSPFSFCHSANSFVGL
jgi:hypothetical protein